MSIDIGPFAGLGHPGWGYGAICLMQSEPHMAIPRPGDSALPGPDHGVELGMAECCLRCGAVVELLEKRMVVTLADIATLSDVVDRATNARREAEAMNRELPPLPSEEMWISSTASGFYQGLLWAKKLLTLELFPEGGAENALG